MSEKYSVYSMEVNKGLIDLLSTAQQNYELANERASSLIKHNQKLNKVLDKAIELLDSNMLCENCPFPKNAERCTVEGCGDYLKECLLEEVNEQYE